MNLNQHSQSNFYYIKSLLKNKYLAFEKKDQLKYAEICDKNFLWQIKSNDQKQNIQQDYSLRFGEFIEIFNNQNQPFLKTPLLVQQTNLEIISSQTFKKLNDNLIQKQPCVLINAENQFYLTIIDDKISFQEFASNGSYFQLIPQQKEFENQIQIQRPILNFSYEFYIRNYKTGYSLNAKTNFNILFLTAIKPNPNTNKEKWTLIQITDNKFEIINHFHKKYISTQDGKVCFIDTNPPNKWKISTIDNKVLTYGTPFIIQNSMTESFLTMNEFNLKDPQNQEQEVIQSKILTPASLWIIFNYSI